jgi:hypothetical protein
LKFIQSDSEFVQWVEILNDISDKSKNVILGCVYIPPEFPPYSSDEVFLQLEDAYSSVFVSTSTSIS